MNDRYKYLVSGCASELYPSETFFGLLYYDQDDVIEIPKEYPFHKQWGYPQSFHLMELEKYPLPIKLDMVWLSVVERKFYSIIHDIPVEKMKELLEIWDDKVSEPLYEFILVGMAPYGGNALWLYGKKKSVILHWLQAEEVQVDMKDFSPLDKNITLEDYCDAYIQEDEAVLENLEENGLPARNLFDKYMQQFCYKYVTLFQQWDEDNEQWVKVRPADNESDEKQMPQFDALEEALFDGTHDKLHDDGLMTYHLAGKPKKLTLQWHIGKNQYSAHWWFDDELICAAYDRFFGTHRDTKVDFLIRIDTEKKKFELALYRYGLQEPVVISEDAYQMLVFKDEFEYYRSENYDQPSGAWIW